MRLKETDELYNYIVEKFGEQIQLNLKYNYFNSILVTVYPDYIVIQPEIINEYGSIINAGNQLSYLFIDCEFEKDINYIVNNLISLYNNITR